MSSAGVLRVMQRLALCLLFTCSAVSADQSAPESPPESSLPANSSAAEPVPATPPPANQLFKWTDTDGHVHYSQTPPPSTAIKVEIVKVPRPQQYNSGVPAPVDPALQPVLPRDSEVAAQARADQRKADRDARKQALQQQHCQELDSRLEDAASDAGPNPDPAKLQALQQIRQQLADECGR